jgi:DNA ligase-associated metallophosphoesterase
MYSDQRRKPRPKLRPAAAAEPARERVRLGGAWITPLAQGALWLAASETLVVSDLHFEKGTAFARGGHFLPPYDTRATLARVAALFGALQPRQVIALGDSFHDRGAAARLHDEDRETLAALVKRTDWIWIKGNHDPEPPKDLGGSVLEALEVEGVVFRHEPQAGAKAEVAGHLHPCARVAGRSGSVRRPCFAVDEQRMVMPAFGAYTGGLNVLDKAFKPLFPGGLRALVMGREKLYPTAAHRLVGDA